MLPLLYVRRQTRCSCHQRYNHWNACSATFKVGLLYFLTTSFCHSDRKLTVFSTIGQTIYDVDLKVTPCKPMKEGSITQFKRIDAAMCGPGLTVVIGNHYYIYDSHCIAGLVLFVGKI